MAHISFLFYNEPVKKFFDVRVLTAESPHPSIGASALLAGPPPKLLPPNIPSSRPPSERMYFMNDPLRDIML